jgi:PPM family protein phosphatase
MHGLMTIGAFSERSGLSARRLRTYAAEGLLIPVALDPGSGYRYYSSAQLPTAELIDALRQAGIPLAEIRMFLAMPSDGQLETWGQRLVSAAAHRHRALEMARTLVAEIDGASSANRADSKERSMPTLHSAARSEQGPVRETNEDVVVVGERLVAIADGMGGHPGGETAATAAGGMLAAVFAGRSADELATAIRAANWAVWDHASAHPALEGMGTTVCAVGLLDDGRLSFANVGDSRAYLWRAGALTRLTRDHSVTAELVERGELRTEDVRAHPLYGVLTRALGVGPQLDVECDTLIPEPGDRLLLCSDGLFNELTDAEITAAINEREDLASVVDDLVEGALARGGRDNVSVVLAQVSG